MKGFYNFIKHSYKTKGDYMKLVFVSDNGFYKKDGKFYFAAPNYAHVNHLKKYFDEFVYVARDDKFDKASFEIDRNSNVFLFSKFNIREIKKKLKEVILDADAVICYGTNGYFAYKIAKKFKKTVIAYNGGDVYDFLISRGTLKGRVLASVARFIEQQKFYNADYAHYCDQFLVEKYPTKGEVLVCSGVSISINEENLEKRKKKIIEKDSNKYVIGLIGHTNNKLKGIETAIRALSQLDGEFELQVVGRGDHTDLDILAQSLTIGDRVKFLGTLKGGQEIFNWLDNVDIYIQPSLIEGLPRATIEAMSRACPIISSNAGGLPRLIDGEYRINSGDYISLAKKIKELVTDKNNLLSQAITNFNKSKEFSNDERTKKYDAFYGEIIKKLKGQEINN